MARVGGGRRQMKRLAAPRALKIKRKRRFGVWITKPSPGPHPKERSIPLRVLVRDYLGYAHNAREADYIVQRGMVKVDGRVVKNPKFPVGLFDTVEIADKAYRIVLDKQGRLIPIEIPPEEANVKIGRVERKKSYGNGFQLGLHDGRTIITTDNSIKPGDVLKIEVPSQNIVDILKLAPGNLVYILSGRHAGTVGEVIAIEKGDLSRPTLVKVRVEGTEVATEKRNVFVVGTKAPVITL